MACAQPSSKHSHPHRLGEQRGTEEMPVAQPLIFPWQHCKHIEDYDPLHVPAPPTGLRLASQMHHCVIAARPECLLCVLYVLICPLSRSHLPLCVCVFAPESYNERKCLFPMASCVNYPKTQVGFTEAMNRRKYVTEIDWRLYVG